MSAPIRTVLPLLLALATCEKSTEPPRANTCTPEALGLASATKPPAFTPPEGCAARPAVAKLVASDEDATLAFGCDGATLGVDFTREAILVEPYSLSPAQVGKMVFDDGARVTFVDMFRQNCPGDPLPMPISMTAMVRIAKGERTIAHATCQTENQCR